MKVLVIGGYGTFGGRLVRLLADRPQLTLLVAGRSSAKARSCCSRNAATANLVPLAFDRDGDVIGQLRDAAPDIVVDASGPFQVYGDDPYAVVKACIALRIDYIDLADSAAFVDGIAAFDEGARQRNLFILSGVSSFPVLTVAAARRLAQGMARIDAVSAGIAPSPFAEVGLNVFRAIASYAGKALAVLRDGREIIAYALIDSRTFTIAPPGHVPLRPRRFTLIDAPELHVLPTLFPHLKSVWVGAGTVPAIFHRCLTLCAFLVRLGLLKSLLPFAAIMHAVRNRLSWGEDRGGMFVAISGWDGDGNPIEREWHMIAEGDDGPFIPAMAAAAVIGHVLNGRRPPGGARDSTADVKLTDYEEQFSRRRIFAGVREKSARPRPLYRRLLGSAYDTLPPTLQRLHDLDCHLIAEGRAKIERGRGILARLIAMALGFPPAGNDIPIAVDFRCDKACVVWRRSFAGREFSSIQEEGRGGFDRLLHERFGPATRAGRRSGPLATPHAALEPVRSRNADCTGAGMRCLRIRKARTLPFLCRPRPETGRTHRPLPGLAGASCLGMLTGWEGLVPAEQNGAGARLCCVALGLSSRNDLGRRRVRDYRCRARDPDYDRPRRAIDSRCCRLFGITREIMETRAPFDPAPADGALEG